MKWWAGMLICLIGLTGCTKPIQYDSRELTLPAQSIGVVAIEVPVGELIIMQEEQSEIIRAKATIAGAESSNNIPIRFTLKQDGKSARLVFSCQDEQVANQLSVRIQVMLPAHVRAIVKNAHVSPGYKKYTNH
ncbi:MAG: hypothetical protein ACM32O_20595 [Clostridia bacterium]